MDRVVRKDIEKRYAAMLDNVTPEHKGMVNCYVCECGRITKVENIDGGATPMAIECPLCGKDAVSSEYREVSPETPVLYEWYRPSLKEVIEMMDKQFFTANYVLSGGLIRRPK